MTPTSSSAAARSDGEEAGSEAEPAADFDPRVVRLLSAIVAISSNLDTHSTLERLVSNACELTSARYGALTVLAADGTIQQFITHGVDPATVRLMGAPPTGKGVLGLTFHDTLRLHDLGSHPLAGGFPPHHPPMRSLLATPIRMRGAVFGNLYLSEKHDGSDFDDSDETVIHALANVAGVVIENARAYGLSERRRVWLERFGELGELLQPPISLEEGFTRIAETMRVTCRATAVAIVQVPVEGAPFAAAHAGRLPQLSPEQQQSLSMAIRSVVATGELCELAIAASATVLVVPLRAHLTTPGALAAWFDAPHDEEETELIASFAEQAGLALDRAQAVEYRAEMAVVSERDRIARDLHDVVIQRLFAAGLHMQATRSMATSEGLGERLEQSVKDLDQTIRDIRGTIFELQTRPQSSLRSDVRDLVREYTPLLGFSPAVQLNGPVDSALEPEFQHQLVAVLREALSNVARHAQARSALVFLEVSAHQVRLSVTDDGVGLPEDRHESGLANAKDRAVLLGGSVELAPNHPRGTSFRWQVPLP